MNSYMHKITLLLFVALCGGCQLNFDEITKERRKHSLTSPDEIHIVAIESNNSSGYINGIKLGVDYINKKDVLQGREIILDIIQEDSDFPSMESSIKKIATNPQVVAVLGHQNPDIAIPASIIYEQSELIFIPPFITSTVLGGSGRFKYVFKMLPDGRSEIEQIASFLKFTKKNRVVLLFSQSDNNKKLAIEFSGQAENRGLKIAAEIPFSKDQKIFSSYIDEIKEIDFDAIVISTSTENTSLLIDQLNKTGINTSIIVTGSVNKAELAKSTPMTNSNVIALSNYNKDNNSVKNNLFKQSYLDKFKNELNDGKLENEPDGNALIGYDSILLLAEVIKNTDSTHPQSLSTALHNMAAWNGVNDIYEFDEVGSLIGKRFYFEILAKGKWLNIPYADKLHTIHLIKNEFDFSDEAIHELINEDVFVSYKYKANLLRLSREILGFKDLGIVYVDDGAGKHKVNYENLIKFVESRNDINLIECSINKNLRGNAVLFKDAAKTCYNEVATKSDAIYMEFHKELDEDFYKDLSLNLHKKRIPLFSIDTPDKLKKFVLLSLDKTKMIFENKESVGIFTKLLAPINSDEIYAIFKNIKNIPEISMNFKKYKHYRLDERAVLDLAPVKQIIE